jgi:hypothetical protein
MAGWLIGIVVAIFFIRLEASILTWFLKRSFKNQLFWIFGISIFFLFLGGVFVFILRHWEMPGDWIRNAADDLAGKNETILSSIGLGAVAGNTGGFLGVALGALLMHRKGGFNTGGNGWKRVLRSVAGLVVFFVLYEAFQLTAPDQTRDFLYSIWRFGGFFAISISAIWLIPLILIRINLLAPRKGDLAN